MDEQYVVSALIPAVLDFTYSGDGDELRRLYEMAKRDQWNATNAIEWWKPVDAEAGLLPDERVPLFGTPYWESLDERGRRKLNQAQSAWILAQFLHGEYITLRACGQIASSIPRFDGTLYVATQVMDEARHVEVYRRYISEKLGGQMYGVNPTLKQLADILLADPRWYFKLIGVQLVIEGLALSSLRSMARNAKDELVRDVIGYVLKDEARHVGFGVIALKDVIMGLQEEEREELAQAALMACGLMIKGFFSADIFLEVGFTESELPEIAQAVKASPMATGFREELRRALVPNFKRVGLLTDKIRPEYAKYGLLAYEDLPLVAEELGQER